MKFSSNTRILLLIVTFEFLWLQNASVKAVPYWGNFDFSSWHENFTRRFDEAFKSRSNRTLDSKDPQKPREGEINYIGSQTYQRNNFFGDGSSKALFGSLDVQVGNTYSGNSNGTNVYGPILVQENNTYGGDNENAQYGAIVVRAGNSYPQNPGKNDIFNPIVIQSNNTYLNNTKKIIKNNTNDGADVKPSGHNKPLVNYHNLTSHHVKLGMDIKEHEEMSKIIHNYLKTEQLLSKQCANGMMNSKRMDEINSLYLKVNSEVTQLKALKRMNSSRKIICDSIPSICSKRDNVRRWITLARRSLIINVNQSKTSWESLREC